MARDPVTFTLSHLMPSDGVLSELVLITHVWHTGCHVYGSRHTAAADASLSLLFLTFPRDALLRKRRGSRNVQKQLSLSLSLAEAPSSSLSLNGGGQTRPTATDLQSPTFTTPNQSFGCSLQHVRRGSLI